MRNYLDETDLDYYETETEIWQPMKPRRAKPKRKGAGAATELAEDSSDSPKEFTPSFASMQNPKNHLSNHEREWILTYLGVFHRDHFITDVVKRVKGGKEATVYCCAADPRTGVELLAGKIYRPRAFRSMGNDSLYRQGREVLDSEGKEVRGTREGRAMAKKTRFGQDLRHMTWLTNEMMTMQKLWKAGADVPRPYAQSENAILMEYMGDEHDPAPALVHVELDKEEAQPLFERLIRNIELMLAHERVHGDLSSHNILYWEGEIKIIDFPQAVDPYANPDAFSIFMRDVKRVCQYFARYGVEADPIEMSYEMWRRIIPEKLPEVTLALD